MYWSVWRDKLEKALERLGPQVHMEIVGCEMRLSSEKGSETVYCIQYSPYRCIADVDFSNIPWENIPHSNQWGNRDLLGIVFNDDHVDTIVYTQRWYPVSDQASLSDDI